VARNQHFDPATLDRLLAAVVDICRRDGAATIAKVRDELGTSRRYAQALLEHLDAARVTLRRDDRHVLRR
jgi:selenocysteine-specific elongation factor